MKWRHSNHSKTITRANASKHAKERICYSYMIREIVNCILPIEKSKEEDKDQKTIQSSTTPDPRHHMGKWQKHKETPRTREPRGQLLPSRLSQGDHKNARNRQESIIKTHLKHKWSATCDFQQCDLLTSVDSDEHVQPPFKLRNSNWCSVSSLTIIDYSSD